MPVFRKQLWECPDQFTRGPKPKASAAKRARRIRRPFACEPARTGASRRELLSAITTQHAPGNLPQSVVQGGSLVLSEKFARHEAQKPQRSGRNTKGAEIDRRINVNDTVSCPDRSGSNAPSQSIINNWPGFHKKAPATSPNNET